MSHPSRISRVNTISPASQIEGTLALGLLKEAISREGSSNWEPTQKENRPSAKISSSPLWAGNSNLSLVMELRAATCFYLGRSKIWSRLKQPEVNRAILWLKFFKSTSTKRFKIWVNLPFLWPQFRAIRLTMRSSTALWCLKYTNMSQRSKISLSCTTIVNSSSRWSGRRSSF